MHDTLREQQSSVITGRAFTDQLATLRIIVEPYMEWDSYLYVNCVDYEQVFDNMVRETLGKILRHYMMCIINSLT